jgi:hypothetical protein
MNEFNSEVSPDCYSREVLAPRPNPTLEEHPLSAVRHIFFTITQLLSTSAGRFFHSQPEDAQNCSAKGHTMNWIGLARDRDL